MYKPNTYTYQGTHGSSKTYSYPGQVEHELVDKNALRKYMSPAREFALKYNAKIYVGEFSVIRWAEGAEKYLDDVVSILEEYGWDWSYHAYREAHIWDLEKSGKRGEPAITSDTPTLRLKSMKKWWGLNSHGENN